MRAVLIAAALTAMAAPAYAQMYSRPPGAEGAPLRPTPQACKALADKTANQGSGEFKRLDQLPPALFEHAVWRTVAGCQVREVVYQGQTYWVFANTQTLSLPLYELAPDTAPDTGSRVIRNH